MHHPCQIAYPSWSTISDFDPDQAHRTRLELLRRFADSDTFIIGTHFSEPAIGVLRSEGEKYFLAPYTAGGSAIP